MPNTIIHTAYIVGFIWFLLAVHLMLSKPSYKLPVRLLALNCLIWAVQHILLAGKLSWEWSLPVNIRPVIAMTLGPVLYWYYLSVSRLNFKFSLWQGAHLLPSIFVLFVITNELRLYATNIDYLIVLSLCVYSFVIALQLLRLGGGNFEHLERYAKEAYLWLWVVCSMMIIAALGEIAVFIEMQLGASLDESIALSVSAWSFLAFTAFTLLCFLRRSPLFEWMYSLGESRRQKYAQSALTADMCNTYFDDLQRFMMSEKPFKQEGITIADIAQSIQLPVRQLSEVINRKQGVSFSRYLNDFRINEAKNLLLGDVKRSITEVMYEAGFYTKSSFNKEFMRVTGMSPTEYRKTH